MKRWVLIALLALLVLPASLCADTIAFSGTNSTGSSWTLGGSPFVFTLSTGLTSVQLNSGTPDTTITGGTIGWTTAAASTIMSNLVIFGPGGTITVTGDLGAGVVNLFSGTFQSASLTLLTGGAPGQSSFSASFINGTINQALLTYLGIPLSPTNAQGTLTGTLNGTFSTSGGSGTVAGTTISVSTVPEPGTLVLLGTGMIGIAGLIRRKLKS